MGDKVKYSMFPSVVSLSTMDNIKNQSSTMHELQPCLMFHEGFNRAYFAGGKMCAIHHIGCLFSRAANNNVMQRYRAT